MESIIKLLEKYRKVRDKELDISKVLMKFKNLGMPTYSTLLLIKSFEIEEKEQGSFEGWVVEGFKSELDSLEKERKSIETEKVKLQFVEEGIKKKKNRQVFIIAGSICTVILLIFLTVIFPKINENKENEFWNTVSVNNTLESYENYLKKFPNGIYKAQAIGLIEKIREERTKEKLKLKKWKNITSNIQTKDLLSKDIDKVELVSKSDNFSVVFFKTDLIDDVIISLNKKDAGFINNETSLAVRLQPGKNYTYEAIFIDKNNKDSNTINSIPGSKIVINLTETESTTSFKDSELFGKVKGNKVNFRSSPSTDTRGNIIGQLNEDYKVSILDKKVVRLNDNFRITRAKTSFKPSNGDNPFLIHKGVAVKYLGEQSNRSLVLLTTDKGVQKGYINRMDLKSMKGSSWYKIKYNGEEGWVYSDFIRTI